MSIDVKLDDKRLKELIKIFNKPTPVGRVGILGNKNGRSDKGQTNSDIGAIHEFGTDGLPQRSFLRVPLNEHLGKYLEKSGAFNPGALDQVQKDGSFIPFVKKMVVVAEAVVQEAFATGGFGKWPPSNMTNKKVQMTLVETQQLRNSITSEVIGGT